VDPSLSLAPVAARLGELLEAPVELLAGVAGFRGEITERGTGPARSAAVGWIQADIRRARRVLGWSPAYQLVDSLKAIWVDGTTAA
jgi:nucleoside-diphosphate-sugar epimerase